MTLREIAEAAGVHVSTASRALARSREGALPVTDAAARVVAIAAEHHYEPDPLASGLRTRRTRILGVLVPRLTDLAVSTMYEGLEGMATTLGYETFVGNTLDVPLERRRRVEALLSRRVDGLILGDARTEDEHLDELRQRDVPFVLMNRRHPPFDSVTCDDVLGGRLAGGHLADLGHRSIGILAGPSYASTALDRTRGCLESLEERGVHVPPDHVVTCAFSPQGGRDATMELMRISDRPTAVFAVTDIMAIGALGALRDLGLAVGRDVALVGYNDISLMKDLAVPVTSVRAPLAEMGAQAARVLVDRLSGRVQEAAPSEVRLALELVVRSSTDPAAGAQYA
jgi:LacI family transcriptional regulator